MKRNLFIILLMILVITNCKYFKKKKYIQNNTVEIPVIDTTTPPVVDKDVYMLDEINDKYLIIVGSFETIEFAKIHAKKYSNFGFDTKVIAKPDGFFMVSAKVYETYDDAHKELPDFRKRIAKKSWVFINHRIIDQAGV